MTDAGRWLAPPPPPLSTSAAHVWRVRLDTGNEDHLYTFLSADERARANAFAFSALRRHYVVAHGMLRHLLSAYAELPPDALCFDADAAGKPRLANGVRDLAFNLSHSGDIALVAVASGRAIGVDVERWSSRVAPAELAPRVFSNAECDALAALAPEARTAGFYAAWTRKEAYMKATGHGITRGFAHFDVTLSPDVPAGLTADRLEADAPAKWRMHALDVGAGYSAAVVVAAPLDELLLFDASAASIAP